MRFSISILPSRLSFSLGDRQEAIVRKDVEALIRFAFERLIAGRADHDGRRSKLATPGIGVEGGWVERDGRVLARFEFEFVQVAILTGPGFPDLNVVLPAHSVWFERGSCRFRGQMRDLRTPVGGLKRSKLQDRHGA